VQTKQPPKRVKDISLRQCRRKMPDALLPLPLSKRWPAMLYGQAAACRGGTEQPGGTIVKSTWPLLDPQVWAPNTTPHGVLPVPSIPCSQMPHPSPLGPRSGARAL